MTPTCPECKSDEAFGRMGNWDQCLICGFVDKNPTKNKELE